MTFHKGSIRQLSELATRRSPYSGIVAGASEEARRRPGLPRVRGRATPKRSRPVGRYLSADFGPSHAPTALPRGCVTSPSAAHSVKTARPRRHS